MVARQGDVFWAALRPPIGSEPGYRHPVVIVQNDVYNRSAIGTTVVCALTSNLALGEAPGNVPLRKGEANLPKRSVASVTQLLTLDKTALREKIGTLSNARMEQILAGIDLVLKPI